MVNTVVETILNDEFLAVQWLFALGAGKALQVVRLVVVDRILDGRIDFLHAFLQNKIQFKVT